MDYFYSKTTRGFYTKELHGEAIPGDAVPVSEQQHAGLMQGQNNGQQIVPDEQGRPVLQVRSAADHIARMTAAINGERDRRVASSGYQVNDNWYPSDALSRAQQMAFVMMGANMPPDLRVPTLNGAVVRMTTVLAQQILAAAAASDAAHFTAAQVHIAAMGASPDPARYDFSNGWPKGFAG